MANDTSKMSVSADASSDSAQIADRLEALISENEKISFRRALLAKVALLLIALGIGIFLFNLYSFVKTYEYGVLMEEVKTATGTLPDSAEFRELQTVALEKALPILKEELQKNFEADLPKFKQEGAKAAQKLQNFLLKDMKAKILHELTEALQDVERDMLQSYPDLNAEDIDKVVKEVQQQFIVKVAGLLDMRLKALKQDLTELQSSFNLLKEDPAYKALDSNNIGKIENQLIETALQLVIYQLNPEKGSGVAGGSK